MIVVGYGGRHMGYRVKQYLPAGKAVSYRPWVLGAAILPFLMGFWVTPRAVQAAEVNKTFTPLQIEPGGISRLQVQIYNSNPTPLTNNRVTDNLPAGMRVADTPNAVTDCANATVEAQPGATSVTISGATVPAAAGSTDGQCTLSVDVTTIQQGNSINTIPAQSLTNDQNETNTTPASATLQVRSVTPPSLNTTFVPNTIFAGQNTLLTIQITNSDSNVTLTNTALSTILPTNLTIAGTATTTCLNGQVNTTSTTLSLTAATIAAGNNCTIAVPVTSTVTGNYTYTIPAQALTTRQGVSNSSPASSNLAVQNLAVTKSFSPTTISTGQSTRLTITLQNPSAQPYTGVQLTDYLPGPVRIASTPNISNTCGGTLQAPSGGSDINLTNGTLPSGTISNPGTCTIQLDVISANSGTYDNVINPGQLRSNEGGQNYAPGSARLVITQSGQTGTLAVDKLFSPSTIAPNAVSRLTIVLGSSNNVNNLTLTDNLPALANGGQIVVANPANPSTSCTGGQVTANPGSTSVSLTGANLGQGQYCNVYVNVTGSVAGLYNNLIPARTITATDVATGQQITNPNPGQRELAITGGLEVRKVFNPDTIAPGGRSVLTVSVYNYLETPVTGVRLEDNLPQGTNAVRVATPPNTTTTCTNGVVTAQPNGTSVTLSGATIPAAQGGVAGLCTFQVEVTSDAANGSNTNVIPPAAITSPQGATNTTSAEAILRFTNLEVLVTKSFNPTTVSGGQTSTLTILLTNPSATIDLFGTGLTDTMPEGLQVAANPRISTTCPDAIVSAISGSRQVTVAGARIARGQSCSVSVDVISLAVGNLTNTILEGAVQSFQGARNPNPASATITNLPALGVEKSFMPATILPGGTAVMAVRVLNARNSPITNLGWADDIPNGVTPLPPVPSENTCGGTVNLTGNRLTLSGGNVGPLASCTVSLNVTATALGSYLNRIPIGALSNQEGATNTTEATATLTVAHVPTLTKTFTPNQTGTNRPVNLTLQLGNTGNVNITLTQDLVDNLPAGVFVATPANVSGTCPTASVNAASGSSSVRYTTGATIPPGGCTISVDVVSSTIGTHVNIVPAGALQTNAGSNPTATSASLSVATASNPNLLLVKRITAINGSAFTDIVDDPNATSDNHPNWPANYLQGRIDGGVVRPGDVIEYTIYFLSAGNSPITNVQLCDPVPSNTTFERNTYASETGIGLGIGTAIANLTNLPDGDAGEYFPVNATPPTRCGVSSNANGVVAVDIVRSPAQLPNATAPGTPPNSYGYIQFRARVK